MDHPVTRVLAVLELLQAHGSMPGAELARRLGVQGRTVRRYIARLEAMGIPVTAERGRGGGYALVAGFKLPPMMFSSDEALALSLGLVAVRGLGLARTASAVASAQAKLERVMPAGIGRAVRSIGASVTLDLARPASVTDAATLAALGEAAQERRCVRMRYRTARGEATEREFDPYGLVYKAGCWYAVGHCHLRRGLRSFRLDRIVSAHTLELRFERPEAFDALGHLAYSAATLPRRHAVAVFLRTGMSTARRELFEAIGVLEPEGDGVLLRGQADDLDWFARELARLPFDFEVRSPAALRTAVDACGRRLRRLAAHATSGGVTRKPRRGRPPSG